jgi:YgiT-type zinc finger domain-containing protein
MKGNQTTYNYGECHVCGEQMEEKEISQEFWIKGELLVVEGVPAGVCPQCGEKVVKSDVGQQVASLLQNANRSRKARVMTVPVIRFEKQVA